MPRFDVTAPPFNATANGSADDTLAIQRAVNAAYAAGGGEVYFPPGRYVLSRRGATPGSAAGGHAVRVPSNVALVGHGSHSIVLNGGMRPGASQSDNATWYDAFECVDGTVNVVFAGLRFVGQNAPFTSYDNRQMACIGVRGTRCADVVVRGCTFDDQYGFTVHNEGSSQRLHVVDCLMRHCANGLNCNGDYSIQARNTLFQTESIEAGGAYITVVDNVLQSPTGSTGIAVGGTTEKGAYRHGVVVANNMIVDAVAGAGITVSDGVHDCVVSDNVVIRTRKFGILVASGGYNPVGRVKVRGNTILDAGSTDAAISERCGIYVGANTDGEVTDNTVEYGVAPGYDTAYGLLVTAASNPVPNLKITGNRVRGSFKSMSLEGATNVFLGADNLFDREKFSTPGATFRRVSARGSGFDVQTPAGGVVVDPTAADVHALVVTHADDFAIAEPRRADARAVGSTSGASPSAGAPPGRLTIEILNDTPGAMGAVIFADGPGGYLTAGVFPSPAPGKRRTISFHYNPRADRWVESHRSATDVG